MVPYNVERIYKSKQFNKFISVQIYSLIYIGSDLMLNWFYKSL